MKSKGHIFRSTGILFAGIFLLFQLLQFLSETIPQVQEFNEFVSDREIDVSALTYTDEDNTFEAIRSAEDRLK